MRNMILSFAVCVGVLSPGCSDSTNSDIKEEIVTTAQAELYEASLRNTLKMFHQKLSLLQQVDSVDALVGVDKQIKALEAQHQEKQKRYATGGRVSYQVEQRIDNELKDELTAVVRLISTEQQRISHIDGVEGYRNGQVKSHRNKRVEKLYRVFPEELIADRNAILEDPTNYLQSIEESFEDWRGSKAELERIKLKLDQYLTLKDSDVGALNLLMSYYLNLSVFDRSKNLVNTLTLFSYIKSLDENNSDLYVYKTAADMRWRDYGEAEKSWLKAKELNADTFWFHYYGALLTMHRGNHDEGIEKLNMLLEANLRESQKAVIYTKLAYHALHQGSDKASALYHKKAVELHPNFHWRHGNYAGALLRLRGKIEAAEREANIARALGSYGKLEQIFEEIQFVKWSSRKNRSDNYTDKSDSVGFDPTRQQSEWMMVRVGGFRHIETAKTVLFALKGQQVDLDEQDSSGDTAMHRAALLGNVETLVLLHQQGASIEVMNQSEETPLLYAIRFDQSKAALKLIDLGANINVISPLAGTTPIGVAVHKGNIELVNKLLELGVSANTEQKSKMAEEGESILISAVLKGNKQMVKLLLSAGADRSAKVMGRTLKEAATELGHGQLLDVL